MGFAWPGDERSQFRGRMTEQRLADGPQGGQEVQEGKAFRSDP